MLLIHASLGKKKSRRKVGVCFLSPSVGVALPLEVQGQSSCPRPEAAARRGRAALPGPGAAPGALPPPPRAAQPSPGRATSPREWHSWARAAACNGGISKEPCSPGLSVTLWQISQTGVRALRKHLEKEEGKAWNRVDRRGVKVFAKSGEMGGYL